MKANRNESCRNVREPVLGDTPRLTRRSFVGMSALGLQAALLGSLSLSGCGSADQSPSDDSSSSSDESNNPSGGDAGASNTNSGGSGSASSSSSAVLTEPLDNGYGSGTHHATLVVQDYGTIELELDADSAPITVSNFAQLANDGFYNGLTFHRIIKGFMVQGGDPNGDGTGGSSQNIKGEFAENGVANALLHKRGTISMARSSKPNSASSQFFIMQEDNDSLNGQYAAFGHVTSGIEVVDAMAEVPVEDSNGTVAAENQPVIESLAMVD